MEGRGDVVSRLRTGKTGVMWPLGDIHIRNA